MLDILLQDIAIEHSRVILVVLHKEGIIFTRINIFYNELT